MGIGSGPSTSTDNRASAAVVEPQEESSKLHEDSLEALSVPESEDAHSAIHTARATVMTTDNVASADKLPKGSAKTTTGHSRSVVLKTAEYGDALAHFLNMENASTTNSEKLSSVDKPHEVSMSLEKNRYSESEPAIPPEANTHATPASTSSDSLPSADESKEGSSPGVASTALLPISNQENIPASSGEPGSNSNEPKYKNLFNSIKEMQNGKPRVPLINIVSIDRLTNAPEFEGLSSRNSGPATYRPASILSRSSSTSSGYASASSDTEHPQQSPNVLPPSCHHHPHFVLNPYYRHPFPPGYSYTSGYPGYDYAYNNPYNMGMGHHGPMPFYRPPVICADERFFGSYGYDKNLAPGFYQPPAIRQRPPPHRNPNTSSANSIPVIVESNALEAYDFDSVTSRGVNPKVLTKCPPSSPVAGPSSRVRNPWRRRKVIRYFNQPIGVEFKNSENGDRRDVQDSRKRKRAIPPPTATVKLEPDSDEPPSQKRRLEPIALSQQPEILFCEQKLTSFEHPVAPAKLYYYTNRENANKIFRQMFIGVDERSTHRRGSGIYFSELGPENDTSIITYNCNFETKYDDQYLRTEFCFEFKPSELPELRFCIDKNWNFCKIEGGVKPTGIWKSAVQRLYLESSEGTYYRRSLDGVGIPSRVQSCTWKM